MGSGSSRLDSRFTRHRPEGQPRVGIAAFLCGGAAAAASCSDPPQIEHKPTEKSIIQATLSGSLISSNIQISVKESPLDITQGNRSSSSTSVDNLSSQTNNDNLENFYGQIYHSGTVSDLPSASIQHESTDTVSPLCKVANCTSQHDSFSLLSFASSTNQLQPLDLSANEILANPYESVSIPTSDTDHVPTLPSVSTTIFPAEDLLVASSLGSDAPTSTRSSEERTGSVLQVDLVSLSSDVSSNPGERSSSESRRNTRRLFWDAFSRQSYRTLDSTPLFSSPENSDLGYQDRWLLDIGDRAFRDRDDDDSIYLRRRRHGLNGVSWHSRSEIRERLRSGLSNNDGQRCPSGLHNDGACSCTLLVTEVSSITRIFVLAEALFEVLDEIHRQRGSLPHSFASVTAPESVVSSLPTKIHKKVETALSIDNVEQCYICLADYENGDAIRILPCHHEYHMICVDKWLKEIHRVCPLCRRDVGEGVSPSSVPNQ
ncbi:uncharacterized protein LOC122028777 isoform X2 [Zingiber officinale]|uniref:uncharacterized protein LOC122028777 isoform X2 n=1 Tax=Zingiber officinale TaxID=94328 RepID=UPI001C4B08D4|nr:uncharacterized protein LOC122028777 isoform X2 [Zingiber officinale]